MVKITIATIAAVVASLSAVSARMEVKPAHQARALEERAASSCTWPSPSKSTTISSPITVKKGQTFDGKNVRYETKGGCNGQSEGGDKDAVFLLEEGATIKNVIIGKGQCELTQARVRISSSIG